MSNRARHTYSVVCNRESAPPELVSRLHATAVAVVDQSSATGRMCAIRTLVNACARKSSEKDGSGNSTGVCSGKVKSESASEDAASDICRAVLVIVQLQIALRNDTLAILARRNRDTVMFWYRIGTSGLASQFQLGGM